MQLLRRRLGPVLMLIAVLVLTGCDGGGGGSVSTGALDGYVYATSGDAKNIQVRGLLEDIESDTLIPLPEVTVTVVGADTVIATTNSNGFFEINGVKTGTYNVTIEKEGYNPLTISSVVVSKNQTTHLTQQNLSFGQRIWNFLVYLDGDNNLEGAAIADINEMEEIGSTDDVNILVLIDRSPGWTEPSPGDDTSNGNWTSTRLYYVTRDGGTSTISSTLLTDLGERDMSDPATLRDFIIYCQEHFPADRTCLTLWNHGGGVYPKAAGKSRLEIGESKTKTVNIRGGSRGICWDDTTGVGEWDCLTTDEVQQALYDARQVTGKNIDVINMDACLTQMLEVAWQWQSEAGYLVGSEETVPGYGNDYATVLGHLTGNPGMTAQAFAKILVDDYYTSYNDSIYDTTYSCIDLGTPFNTLRSRFSTFASALNNTSDMAAVYLAWGYVTTYFDYIENIDLYKFADDLSLLSDDTAVVNAANNLKTAITGAVYCRNTGVYADVDFPAYGVAIMLPTWYEWDYYSGSNQYVTLDMSIDTQWDEFIQDFVAFTEYPASTAETLTASITWASGDCDLYVYDYDDEYWVSEGSSPNGTFSADQLDGGTEIWTLDQPHVPGLFAVCAHDYDYTGDMTCSINRNGDVDSVTIGVVPDGDYLFWYDLVKRQFRAKAIKPGILPIETLHK